MTLYELSISLWPFSSIYGRSKEDVQEWMEIFRNKKEFHGIDFTSYDFGGRTIESITKVENGEIFIDSSGPVTKQTDVLKLTEDFTARIRLLAVPYFRVFQHNLNGKKEGNLVEIISNKDNLDFTWYVPEDVFQALKEYDISPHEEKASKHIEAVNHTFRENPYKNIQFTQRLKNYKDTN